MMKKRLIGIIFALALCIGPLALHSNAAGFTVSGGEENKDYTYRDNKLTVLTETPLTLSGDLSNTKLNISIKLNNGEPNTANITFQNLSIITDRRSLGCINISGTDGTENLNLTLSGENTLKNSYADNYDSSLSIGIGGTTTIDGDGSLVVESTSYWAINSICPIEINGGYISAKTDSSKACAFFMGDPVTVNNGVLRVNGETLYGGGGTVDHKGGLFLQNETGTVKGDVTLYHDFTLVADGKITVEDGATLTVEDGKQFIIESGATLAGEGTVEGDVRNKTTIEMERKEVEYDQSVDLIATITANSKAVDEGNVTMTVSYFSSDNNPDHNLSYSAEKGGWWLAFCPKDLGFDAQTNEYKVTVKYTGVPGTSTAPGYADSEVQAKLQVNVISNCVATPHSVAWDKETSGKVTWKIDSTENVYGYAIYLYKDNAAEEKSYIVVRSRDIMEYTFTDKEIDAAGDYEVAVEALGDRNYANSPLSNKQFDHFYEVTWLDGDGKTLDIDYVIANGSKTYSGPKPTKTADSESEFEFNGTWLHEGKTVTKLEYVNSTETLTAQFDRKHFTPTGVTARDSGITGVTEAMEYRAAGASDWTPCSGTTLTGLAPGRYQVRVRATEGLLASDPVEVTVYRDDSDDSDDAPTTTTITKRNPDGSTTTTTTNEITGTVTETTRYPDGSAETVETKKDGTVTTTEKRPDGVKIETVDEPGEDLTVSVTLPKKVDETVVTIPVDADVTTVLMDARTGEIIKTVIPTGEGLRVLLDRSADLIVVDNSKHFDDADHWAGEAIAFVSAREIMNGTGKAAFSPDAFMTRGMLAMILHNLEGNPRHNFAGSFHDVDGHWAADAIYWAAERGIVSGYPDGSFGADDNITREQLVVMLWNYAGKPESSHSLDRFKDVGSISPYAQMAMSWANENGIMGGIGNNILAPKGTATRAQVAVMLMQMMQNCAGDAV